MKEEVKKEDGDKVEAAGEGAAAPEVPPASSARMMTSSPVKYGSSGGGGGGGGGGGADNLSGKTGVVSALSGAVAFGQMTKATKSLRPNKDGGNDTSTRLPGVPLPKKGRRSTGDPWPQWQGGGAG